MILVRTQTIFGEEIKSLIVILLGYRVVSCLTFIQVSYSLFIRDIQYYDFKFRFILIVVWIIKRLFILMPPKALEWNDKS